MEQIILKGKNIDQILKKYSVENNTPITQIRYKILDEKLSLLRTSTTISILTDESIIEKITSYLNTFSKLINIEIKPKINIEENIILINIKTNHKSDLIGKFGSTLNSIERIMRIYCKTKIHNELSIHLDVENYKQNKQQDFITEISSIFKSVESTKIPADLDPMNSYYRRIVHTEAKKYTNIITKSFGDEKEKYMTILYKEKQD